MQVWLSGGSWWWCGAAVVGKRWRGSDSGRAASIGVVVLAVAVVCGSSTCGRGYVRIVAKQTDPPAPSLSLSLKGTRARAHAHTHTSLRADCDASGCGGKRTPFPACPLVSPVRPLVPPASIHPLSQPFKQTNPLLSEATRAAPRATRRQKARTARVATPRGWHARQKRPFWHCENLLNVEGKKPLQPPRVVVGGWEGGSKGWCACACARVCVCVCVCVVGATLGRWEGVATACHSEPPRAALKSISASLRTYRLVEQKTSLHYAPGSREKKTEQHHANLCYKIAGLFSLFLLPVD